MNTPEKPFLWCVVLIIVCTLVISIQLPPVYALNQGSNHNTIDGQTTSKKITSFQGIEFQATFKRQSLTLNLNATNTNKRKVNKSGFVVTIDGSRFYEKRGLSFHNSEKKEWRISIAHGINTIRRGHTVTISTFGDSVQFNFTKEINSSNSRSVPTPYIQNVEVANGTIDGDPSAVAKVTVVNPSIHPYPLKLMVHTLGTDGSFYGASVAPGGTDTITVELLDERGTQIAGEARLYAGNLSEGDGAMDQVGFVGQAGENTKTWNETYEPIEGPWRSDGYEYRNATYEDETSLAERLSGGHEIFGIPIVYLVSGLVVGLVLARRIR